MNKKEQIAEAETLARRQMFDEAADLAREIIADQPTPDPAARLVLARALYGLGQDDRALEELTALVDNAGDNVVVWRLIGRIHFENCRRSEAENALNRVLEKKPTDQYSAAIINTIKGDGGSHQGMATVTLAELYNDQGQKPTAIEILKKIAVSQPENRKAMKMLSRLLATDP